jgi:hypothetical protein
MSIQAKVMPDLKDCFEISYAYFVLDLVGQ